MGTHTHLTAEYFAARRRAKGITPREDSHMYTKAAVARGKELAAMMAVPPLQWPTNLYDDVRTSDGLKLVAQKVMPEDKCAWEGCNNRHNSRWPLTPERNPHGSGFQAIKYVCCQGCMTLYYRKRAK